MRCDRCEGHGIIKPGGYPIPCPECLGAGFTHCCRGDQPSPYDEYMRGWLDGVLRRPMKEKPKR